MPILIVTATGYIKYAFHVIVFHYSTEQKACGLSYIYDLRFGHFLGVLAFDFIK